MKILRSIEDFLANGLKVGKDVTINKCSIRLKSEKFSIFIDDYSHLDGVHLEIGENSDFYLGVNSKLKGTVIINDNGKFSAGAGLVCNSPVLINITESCSVDIGRDCLFANPTIMTSDFHGIYGRHGGGILNKDASVKISDRVWLATNTVVLKGADIGSDSIVGAGACVSGRIDDFSVAIGSPAKVIKSNIAWNRERIESASPIFDGGFSLAEISAFYKNSDFDKVLEKGIKYFYRWPLMNLSNNSLFYYMAKILIEKNFRSLKSNGFCYYKEMKIDILDIKMIFEKILLIHPGHKLCLYYITLINHITGNDGVSIKLVENIEDKKDFSLFFNNFLSKFDIDR